MEERTLHSLPLSSRGSTESPEEGSSLRGLLLVSRHLSGLSFLEGGMDLLTSVNPGRPAHKQRRRIFKIMMKYSKKERN